MRATAQFSLIIDTCVVFIAFFVYGMRITPVICTLLKLYIASQIVEKVKNIVNQIKEHEIQARKKIFENNKDYIEDKLWRSYGTLKYARSVSSKEAKALVSDVLMGKNMGIIETNANLNSPSTIRKASALPTEPKKYFDIVIFLL